jgi:hypothetical protein
MIAPSASFVEAAIDTLKDADFQAKHGAILAVQNREIRFALPHETEEFYRGYGLGLMVARVLLMGMVNAVKNGVEI